MKTIELIKDLFYDNWKDLEEDFDGNIPQFIKNINGKGIIKKGTRFLYGYCQNCGSYIIKNDLGTIEVDDIKDFVKEI